MPSSNIQIPFYKNTRAQKEFLGNGIFGKNALPLFNDKISESGITALQAGRMEIFQVNIGYMCNQTCKHCHVDAGPDRKEKMSRDVMRLCLNKIEEFGVNTVDITGGAPEMNSDFRWFVEELRKNNVGEIIVRSNLTIVLANPKYYDLPEFFKNNNIRIVSSLPYFQADKTNRQRGKGVFEKSVEVLKRLNDVGYGTGDLILDLVYNPGGAFLPGLQHELENDFKKELKKNHDIVFNNLLALTNLPINRFLDYLISSGNYKEYMEKLVTSFNPNALNGLMCRNTLSVDYLGNVFDCDFNQMLNLPVETKSGFHLSDLTNDIIENRNIVTGQHCYGCTAGAGSSCQGSLV